MPLKLTWGIAKRSFFSKPFRFFLVLAFFPFCAFKTDLGNCQKELFLEPFSFFFRFVNFFLSLPLKLTSGIAKGAFSRTLFIFFFFIFFPFFFRFFHFIFHFRFFSFPFSFRFSFSFFFRPLFHVIFHFHFFRFPFHYMFKFIFSLLFSFFPQF